MEMGVTGYMNPGLKLVTVVAAVGVLTRSSFIALCSFSPGLIFEPLQLGL